MSAVGRRAAAGAVWPWAPAVALGAGLTWLALRSMPRRSPRTDPASGAAVVRRDEAAGALIRTVRTPDVVLAGALAVTGVVHLLEAPSHWAEGWHLGLFFAASAAVLLGQAIAAVTRADVRLYASVLVTTLGLVVLYVLAREVPLPLVDHRDPYLLSELPVKALELGIAGLSALRLTRVRDRPALVHAALAHLGDRPGRPTVPEYRAARRTGCPCPGACNRL